jgi:low affinity Fe/Cu permease
MNAREVRVPRRPQRAGFDRFAEAAAGFVSHGFFFTACLLVVLLWIPTILLLHDVDTWQLVVSTLTSVMAFLLIALLQNSERRHVEDLRAAVGLERDL